MPADTQVNSLERRLQRLEPPSPPQLAIWRRVIVHGDDELAEAEREADAIFAAQGIKTIVRVIVDPVLRD